MSKVSEKFAELLKDERSEGPALTDSGVKRFFTEIGAEVVRQIDHGSTELMAGIYTGSPFTPYGWSHTDPGQDVEVPKAMEAMKQPELEQDHGIER